MKKLLFLFLLIFISLTDSLFCQFNNTSTDSLNKISNQKYQEVPASRSTVYAELGGGGGYYSIGYDEIVLNKNDYKVSLGLGYEFIPYPGDNIHSLIPQINLLYGKNNKFINFGVALDLLFRNNYLGEMYIKKRFALSASYRYQKETGGFSFLAGLNFFIFEGGKPSLIPWPGIRFGYTFPRFVKKRIDN